jgi:hypothetical protein
VNRSQRTKTKRQELTNRLASNKKNQNTKGNGYQGEKKAYKIGT